MIVIISILGIILILYGIFKGFYYLLELADGRVGTTKIVKNYYENIRPELLDKFNRLNLGDSVLYRNIEVRVVKIYYLNLNFIVEDPRTGERILVNFDNSLITY